jgi:hypothetical protein
MSEPSPRKQVPSVGRVVHYVAYGTPGGEFPAGICRAAIITQVHADEMFQNESVGLCVLNPTGQFFNTVVAHDEGKRVGSWHWPEFVPPA